MEDEQRQFASEDLPDARDWTLVTFKARHKHLASHLQAQWLRLHVAVDVMTSHVDRPGYG